MFTTTIKNNTVKTPSKVILNYIEKQIYFLDRFFQRIFFFLRTKKTTQFMRSQDSNEIRKIKPICDLNQISIDEHQFQLV
jgi:hypothetical protein